MEKGFDYHLDTLPSGLRLVTVPMPSAKTATVLVLVSTGSKYESREQNGISHFLEHMMFKGTAKRPGYLDISKELDRIGASYNAFTGKELTGYYAKAAATKLDTIMDVVFDIFLNSKLEQGAMEIERGPIIEELRMRRDDPQQHLANLLEETLYGDQPAGWEVGGNDATITAMMAPDLRAHFDKHYVAENTVIAVAGDIDVEKVRAKAQAAFEHIRQAPRSQKLPVIQEQQSPIVKVMSKEVEQVYVNLALRAYDMYDDRRYPLALMSSILGSGMSSRLFEEVRSKRGLAYFVDTGVNDYTDAGYFEVSAGLNKAKATEGIKVIIEELAKMAAHGVTDDELARTKDQAEGRLAFTLESTSGVTNNYGASALFYNRILTPEEELGKLLAVTASDIQAVAKDIFQNKGLNMAVIGPDVKEESFASILSF